MYLLQQKFAISERRACRVVGQHRSSQRYKERQCGFRERLAKRLRELSGKHPRFGYRRMTALLLREGWRVNRKRVQRLWRLEGLRVPVKGRKRRRLGSIDGSITWRRAEHRLDVWSYDFVMDATEDGRRLKMLPIVDVCGSQTFFQRKLLEWKSKSHSDSAGLNFISERKTPVSSA